MTEENKTTGTSFVSRNEGDSKINKHGGIMVFKRIRSIGTAAFMFVALLSLSLAGCGGGGGGGVSSQVVSGVASVGATLAGQVSLKDASSTPQVKTAVIGSDGSFAIDVTGMKAPYVLQATGSAGGTNYKLHSYADGTGTANINPLSDVIVASAAGVDDASQVYDNPDSDKLGKIKSNISATVATLLAKLQPLLQQYNAQNTNPITAHYIVNHINLDDMFDNVKITVANGILSILNAKTNAVIYTGNVTDIANGNFYPDAMPPSPAAPTAPSDLTATGGAGQVALSWTSVSNATSYNVYYSTTSGVTTANGTKIAGATNPYIQSGLTTGATCYYIVTAVNSAGESAPSAQVSAITTAAPPTPTVPGTPTGLIATGGTKQVTLSWSAVSGATSYNIYWSKTSGVTSATGTKISGVTSPAVHSGLSDSTTHYYIVTAVNSVGESSPSVQVAATTLTPAPAPTAPTVPTGVTATGGAKQMTVSWSAVTGATSYNIYWSTTSGVTVASGTRIAGATSPYVQTGLSAGTSYYYIVTAVNASGESPASAQAMATTNAPPAAVPVAPTGVTASSGANQVTVSWSAVSGATSYNIYWSKTSGVTTATGTKITGATSPYVQTGLSARTAYYYIVTAVNASGESPSSAQATATTNAPLPVVPVAPTGVTATGGTKQVSISWPSVGGATSYNIYWSTTTGVTTATGTKIASATSPYIQVGLADSTTYFYIVTAVNSAGESAASAQVTATTSTPAPAFDALAFYNNTCLGCHGSLGLRTAAQITSAIATFSQMSQFRSTGSNPLTAAQIAAIAAVSH